MAVSPDPVIQYYNIIGRYPANDQQWWLARSEVDDSTRSLKIGDFMPELLQKLYMGNMHAPRGHYILDAFHKDRSTISGIPSLPVETIDERPPTVAFFSGRAWFACGSTVYFSQVIQNKDQVGKCYMDADPTSENISDPIATDGGVIPLPEANKIIRLAPFGGGVMVFALNGVWFITGTSAGFTAVDISVKKVSPVGCQSPQSVVETENSIYWWSDIGIMGAALDRTGIFVPASSGVNTLNISEPTIHSFYNNISDAARSEVVGIFDGKANVVHWLYRDDDVVSSQFNKVLILDLGLQAFYPWKFSSIVGGPVIKGMFISDRENSYTIPTDIRPSQVEYVVMPTGTTLRVAQARSGQFVDWYTYNSVGVTYDSYIEAGYEIFDDAMRNKNITYLFTYLTRTETAIVSGQPNYPSSCQMSIKWDWANSSISNKWTTPVETYRPGRLLLDSADTGFSMVVTKSKVRGNGKAIQFRYECSDAGKNFDLVGWSVAVSGTPIP